MFQKAVKHEAKLRLAIAGPSGSGKTYTALSVGTALGKTAVIDTEHGSASKYADIFEFDVLNLDPPFHPQRFVEAIHAAEQGGYAVIIIDSISHAWNGTGGVLEIVEQASKKFKGNSYAGWQEGTPAHNSLIEGIVSAGIHVISTMRSKQEYILQTDQRGKQVPQKVGMAPVQRDGFEYEFDVFLDMDIQNNAIVSKTRCTALTGAVISKPGADLAATLQDWLSGAPEPTRDDVLADLKTAKSLQAWSVIAYKLPEVRNAFESAQRVADWYGFAVGDFNAAHNGKVTDALKKYTDAKADGVGSREAAEASRQTFKESVKQQPLFEETAVADSAYQE